jgi:hypothetical protein
VDLEVEVRTSDDDEASHRWTGSLFEHWSPGAVAGVRFFQSEELRDIDLHGDLSVRVSISGQGLLLLPASLSAHPVLVGGGLRK